MTAEVLKDIAAILTAPATVIAITALVHSINTRKRATSNGDTAGK